MPDPAPLNAVTHDLASPLIAVEKCIETAGGAGETMDIVLSVLKTSCSSSRNGGGEYAFGMPITEQTAINMPISWKSPVYRYKVLLPYNLLTVIVPETVKLIEIMQL